MNFLKNTTQKRCEVNMKEIFSVEICKIGDKLLQTKNEIKKTKENM